VFPAGVFGYLIATATTDRIQSRRGRRGIALVSSVSRLVFALLLSSAPAFPLFLIGFVGFGYGTGLTDTAWNSWASSTSQPNVVQGILHGSFSVGCVAGPALATVVLRKSSWSLLYGVLVSPVNISYFLHTTTDYLQKTCALFIELVVQTWAFHRDTGTNASTEIASRGNAKNRSLLRNYSLWLCSAYYLVYQGIEGESSLRTHDLPLIILDQLPSPIGSCCSLSAHGTQTQPQQLQHLPSSG
jgi:MFS family permease